MSSHDVHGAQWVYVHTLKAHANCLSGICVCIRWSHSGGSADRFAAGQTCQDSLSASTDAPPAEQCVLPTSSAALRPSHLR